MTLDEVFKVGNLLLNTLTLLQNTQYCKTLLPILISYLKFIAANMLHAVNRIHATLC